MGLLQTLKDVNEVATHVQNMELYRELAKLQTEVMELYEQNRELAEKNRNLTDQLEMRQRLIYKKNLYWDEGKPESEGPYCPKCFDGVGAARKMMTIGTNHLFGCSHCELLVDIKGQPPTIHERDNFMHTLQTTKSRTPPGDRPSASDLASKVRK